MKTYEFFALVQRSPTCPRTIDITELEKVDPGAERATIALPETSSVFEGAMRGLNGRVRVTVEVDDG